jgi:hypothetical protein
MVTATCINSLICLLYKCNSDVRVAVRGVSSVSPNELVVSLDSNNPSTVSLHQNGSDDTCPPSGGVA